MDTSDLLKEEYIDEEEDDCQIVEENIFETCHSTSYSSEASDIKMENTNSHSSFKIEENSFSSESGPERKLLSIDIEQMKHKNEPNEELIVAEQMDDPFESIFLKDKQPVDELQINVTPNDKNVSTDHKPDLLENISKYKKNKRKNPNINAIRRNKHHVKPPCATSCRRRCRYEITTAQQQKINHDFWLMNFGERSNFLKKMTSKKIVARKTVDSSKRQYTMGYTLHNANGEVASVCQTFFLATLGYSKNNNSILKRVQIDTNEPSVDKRGKHDREVQVTHQDDVKKHIESFTPIMSSCQSDCTNKRYLPSDITIKVMHDSFREMNPNIKCSYDTYRNIVSELNISFAVSENEGYDNACEICTRYSLHKTRSKKSHDAYELSKSIPWSETEICVSVNLQKAIMLPRAEMLKKILFTKRINAFNESFVPVGKLGKNKKPMAVIWHEAISGQNQEDIISSFYKFFLYYRDIKKIKIWLEDGVSQNKNWSLFSFLATVVNSRNINAEEIELLYFEPGHNFTSVDSFQEQVELSLTRKQKIYDFYDFTDAVKMCNKGNVIVEVMTEQDFYLWEDNSLQLKIIKTSPRPFLSKMVKIKFKRDNTNLFYTNKYDDNYIELPFLKNSYIKSGLTLPQKRTRPIGITAEHHNQILKDIIPLIPKNRHSFWQNLLVRDASTVTN